MDVNPTKSKKLSKMRTQATDGDYRIFTPPRVLTLESAMEFIDADELVEVTPSAIRLRKRLLSEHDRRRAAGAAYERRRESDQPS
jgi:GTP-binding protein